jgi:uncharacterized protein YwqG
MKDHPNRFCKEYDILGEKQLIPKKYDEWRLDEDELEELDESNYSNTTHKLWGYPSFTQDDPRETDEYMLLFQLVSDEYVSIGDAGIMNFFIKPKDLKSRDFSNVWYNWDCC